MALNGFAPSAFDFVAATNTKTTKSIPGTPAVAIIQNIGTVHGWVNLGATVGINAGLCVLPGEQQILTVGSNTQVSFIGLGALFNVSYGT